MKGNRKTQKSYFISIEGETEKWYFEHLEKLINACETRKQDVKFKIVIEKRLGFASRQSSVIYPMDCFHIFDFEGTSENDNKNFETLLRRL